ncbi:hypothetical protein METBIDRAFT_60997, partial [Metschnikowia bicuspidata var. bicuspidata NRRL YB-4993]
MLKLESLAHKGEAGQLVLQRIKELETLFSSVTNSEIKELSMYMKDSEALRKTTEFASTNAEHIRFGDLGGTLPLEHYLKAVKQYMNPDIAHEQQGEPVGRSAEDMNERFNSFDWDKLGNWFYLRGRVPVPSHFLCGPLATQRRRIATRTRTIDDTVSSAAITTARKVDASELENDPEQSTSHMVRALYNVIREKDPETKVSLYRLFINPHSFSQSVENLFYISFLARDGRIRIDEGPDNVPYVEIPDKDQDDDEDQDEESLLLHYIASLDQASWNWLIDRYNITDSYVPHRTQEEDRISE